MAPAFINLAVAELESILPRNRLEAGGFAIYTTLEYQLQEQANCLIAVQQSQQGDAGTLIPITDNPAGEYSSAEVNSAKYCSAKDCSIEHCSTEHLPPLQLEPGTFPLATQAEAIVLNPQNGQVLALASNPTPRLEAGYLPTHPAGSLGTPFIYLTAFHTRPEPSQPGLGYTC